MRAPAFQCDIVFEKQRLFFSSDLLSGTVEVRVSDAGVYVCDHLCIELVGAVKWTTQETVTHTNSDGSTSTSTRTVSHEQVLVRMQKDLLRVGKGEKIQFNPTAGVPSRFPFSFVLPSSLQPSVDGDPGISYWLVCSHSKSILSGYRTIENFRVGGLVHPERLLRAHEGKLVSDVRKPFLGDPGAVQMDCYFSRSVLARGEKVGVRIKIHNSTNQKITQVVFMFARSTNVSIPLECNPGSSAEIESVLEVPRDASPGFFDAESRQHLDGITIRLKVESALRCDLRYAVKLSLGFGPDFNFFPGARSSCDCGVSTAPASGCIARKRNAVSDCGSYHTVCSSFASRAARRTVCSS